MPLLTWKVATPPGTPPVLSSLAQPAAVGSLGLTGVVVMNLEPPEEIVIDVDDANTGVPPPAARLAAEVDESVASSGAPSDLVSIRLPLRASLPVFISVKEVEKPPPTATCGKRAVMGAEAAAGSEVTAAV